MRTLTVVGAGPVGVAAASAAINEGVVEGIAVIVDPDDQARTAAIAALGGPGCRELPGCAGLSELALVAFSSRLEPTVETIEVLLDRGAHVVTTCEELSGPPPSIRLALDEAASSAGRAVVATGANPGFVMDRLPLVAAGGARTIRRIEVLRRVNTRARREPLVAKTGRGLDPAEFAARARAGTVGHVGLDTSARLVAEGLGWDTERETHTIDPVTDDGGITGIHQTFTLSDRAGRELRYDLKMAWGLPDPQDVLTIDGEPPLTVVIPGGYHGDRGTSSRVVRGLQAVGRLRPGFYRPIDLPIEW